MALGEPERPRGGRGRPALGRRLEVGAGRAGPGGRDPALLQLVFRVQPGCQSGAEQTPSPAGEEPSGRGRVAVVPGMGWEG